MTNPTSNYGFVLPTATDLVTDLPADFEVALQGVDTRLKALQPGTTLGDLAYSSATANTNTRLPVGTNGQVLAVVAGVPAWQNGTTGDIEGVTAGVGISGGGTSGTVTVTNSMATAITTAGDLIKGTGSGTFDRLGIGSTGQVLTVSAGAPAWATPGGSLTVAQIATGTLSGASVTISSLSSYDQLFIQLRNVDMSSVTGMGIRVNNNSGASNYNWNGFSVNVTSGVAQSQPATDNKFMPFYQGNLPASAQDNCSGFTLSNCKSAGFTTAYWSSFYKSSNAWSISESAQGQYLVSEAVSSLVFVAASGTFDGGTYTIWGG